MSSFVFDSFLYDLAKGNIDADSDTFYGMLTTNSYAESKAHTKRSDVTNEVPATGGYTAGGSAVAFTVTVDPVTHRVEITFASQVYAASTITARKQVIYKHRGGASSADELVCINDAGSDVISSSTTLTIPGSTIRLQL